MLYDENILRGLRAQPTNVPLYKIQIGLAEFSSWVYNNAETLKLLVDYDAPRELPIIRAAKSTIHSAISNSFMSWFRDICRDKPPGSEGYKGTTEEVTILKQTGSHKYPDASLTKATRPIIAVEAGVTQSLESLFLDCRQYLRDGNVQAVIVVKLYEHNRNKILDPPPWGMSAVQLQTHWKDDTLPAKVIEYHETQGEFIIGRIKLDLYFWSTERVNPPPSPIWSAVFEKGHSQGEFFTGLRNPMLNGSRIRVFGKEYELPVGELTEDVTKAIEDEKIKRVIDGIGQHITREKQDLFQN